MPQGYFFLPPLGFGLAVGRRRVGCLWMFPRMSMWASLRETETNRVGARGVAVQGIAALGGNSLQVHRAWSRPHNGSPTPSDAYLCHLRGAGCLLIHKTSPLTLNPEPTPRNPGELSLPSSYTKT